MSNVENVCPQVLRGVARELRRLVANPPSGIKLVVREDDLTDVVALIEGPGIVLIIQLENELYYNLMYSYAGIIFTYFIQNYLVKSQSETSGCSIMFNL